MTRLYLDLNHWIELSKVRVGHSDAKPEYAALYEDIRHGTESRDLAVPLSEIHYSEIRDRIPDVAQRNDLALTMSALSSYQALPPRHLVVIAELTRAVASVIGRPAPPATSTPGLGYGSGYAQRGRPLDGRLVGKPQPVQDMKAKLRASLEYTENFVGGGWRFSQRDRICEWDWQTALTALFNESAEFMILRGPRPKEMDDLKGRGYDPDALAQLMVDVTQRELRMKHALMEKQPGDRRPADIAACAALVREDGPYLLAEACLALGLPPTWAGGFEKTRLTATVDATPVLDVERALRLRRLKNGDYAISGNDLYDMAALGVAVAMCDVVATDKSAASMLRAAAMEKRHDCVIVARPAEIRKALVGVEGHMAPKPSP
jgi:hypothetical protein